MTRKKFSWAEQYQVHWALLLAILIGWLFEVRVCDEGGGVTDEGRDDRLVCQLWLSKRSLSHSEGVVFMLSCYG